MPATPPLATWRRPFLEALSEVPNISRAARIAGVTYRWARQCFTNDPDFAEEWAEAMDIAVERLEEAAFKRAVGEGRQYKFNKKGQPLRFPEGHPQAGKPYYEHVASDAMTTLLLKAHRPEKYKDRSAVDVQATVRTEPLYDLSKLSLEDKLALREMKRKLAGGGEAAAL